MNCPAGLVATSYAVGSRHTFASRRAGCPRRCAFQARRSTGKAAWCRWSVCRRIHASPNRRVQPSSYFGRIVISAIRMPRGSPIGNEIWLVFPVNGCLLIAHVRLCIAGESPSIDCGFCRSAGLRQNTVKVNCNAWDNIIPCADFLAWKMERMAKKAKKAAAKGAESSGANIGFESKLWLAADKMRNNMDAAE